jgi:hypothetical protein
MVSSTTTPPALPVWPTVKEAFAAVSANWQAVLRICWAWVLILVAAGLLLAGTFPGEGVPPTIGFVVAMLVFFAIFVVAWASIAVAWHRLMLGGEQPPSLYLRVGGQVPRYLGRFLLICLVAGVIQLLCSSVLVPILICSYP